MNDPTEGSFYERTFFFTLERGELSFRWLALVVDRHRRKLAPFELAPFELAEVKMQMLVDLRSAVVEYELIARYDLKYTIYYNTI